MHQWHRVVARPDAYGADISTGSYHDPVPMLALDTMAPVKMSTRYQNARPDLPPRYFKSWPRLLSLISLTLLSNHLSLQRAGSRGLKGAPDPAPSASGTEAEERTSGAGANLISGGRFGGRPSSPAAGSASDPRRPAAPSGTDLGERRVGPSRAALTRHGGGAEERRGGQTNGARGAMVGAEASVGGARRFLPAAAQGCRRRLGQGCRDAGLDPRASRGRPPNGLIFFVRQKCFWYRLVFPTGTNGCLRHRVKNPVS